MKLIVPLPTEWAAAQDGNERTVTMPNGVILTISDVTPAPDDDRFYAERALRRGLAAGAKVTIGQASALKTNVGWPITLLQADVGDGEARLLVYYRFWIYAATVLVRAKSMDLLQSVRDSLLDRLGQASPDWAEQGVLSIAQLFADLDHPAD